MSKRAHALDSYLGRKLVNSFDPPERRRSPAELKRMDIADQLIYLRHHPETEEQKLQDLVREDRDSHYDMTGEVDERDKLDNEPPASWGN